MKSFTQFITEVYDKDLTTATRKQGEGGRVRASRKKTDPEKRRTKFVKGKKVPTQYKDRKDIGTQKPRSSREQQPTQKRGSAKLSLRDQQKKAREERMKANAGGKGRADLKKAADKLLSTKKKKTVSPKYKPQKASGYTPHQRKKLERASDRLLKDIKNKKEKPASHYDPKL
tara:strand:+ start:24 stop:539 length:516 start_codon:yes stop_codon:yes gene_type:complete